MTEVWTIVVGTGDRYEVSNLGRIRRSDGLFLVPSVPRNRREYPCVMLRHDGRRRRVAVHRLVALNFIGLPPFPGAEVRHLDGDHLNPRLDNLAWGTAKDNASDREQHGRTARGLGHGMHGKAHLKGQANKAAKLTDDEVRAIRELAGTMSQRAIAIRFRVSQTVVWRIIRRKAWAHVKDSAALRARSA